MRRRGAAVDPVDITVPEVAEAMSAAVRHWLAESNGVAAAQEFWSASAVSPDDFAAVFERLPLAAWPTGEARARLHPASSDRVLRVLLTTAVRSPAYGTGMFGAYGRLAVWRSLGGLVGAAPDAPVDDTALLVEQAHCFIADPSSAWFHQVAWDLAVAALRPGGQEIAVLTATDTDESGQPRLLPHRDVSVLLRLGTPPYVPPSAVTSGAESWSSRSPPRTRTMVLSWSVLPGLNVFPSIAAFR